jgi:hypothetical protein
MTREESIKKADKIIEDLRNAARDIEAMKEYFVDLDENIEGVGPLIDLPDDLESVGAEIIGDRISILFYRKYHAFTKNIMKK